VNLVAAGPSGKKQTGPYHVPWERRSDEEAEELLRCLHIPANDGQTALAHAELRTRIATLPMSSVIREVTRWIEHQCHTLGRSHASHQEIRASVLRCLERRGQIAAPHHRRLTAMTIHQAKNREFDGVVIVWPYQVAGDLDQKRRLLYNI
jgi:hypothetical protein